MSGCTTAAGEHEESCVYQERKGKHGTGPVSALTQIGSAEHDPGLSLEAVDLALPRIW